MIICSYCKNEILNADFLCNNCNNGPLVIDDIVIFNPEMDEKCNDYDSSGLDVLHKVENSHFWFLQRKKVIKYFFNRYVSKVDKVIEIGSGTGNVTIMLKDDGYDIAAGEIHTAGLKYAQAYGVLKCYQFDLFKIPFINEFDTICMFDVLEHLEYEKEALNNISKSLTENGKLILTVPAYNVLWNRDDAIAFHKRRYTKHHLNKTLIENGFEIIESKYFFASILPLLLLRRFLNKDDGSQIKSDESTMDVKQPFFINSMLNFILSIEFIFFKLLPIPFGGSIIVVARKIV